MFPNVFTNMGLGPIVKARYLLFLMGFFATFCGICYNDFMSLPVESVPSCYKAGEHGQVLENDCIYPLGVDWKWYLARNNLEFMNSMKMKIAVIFGVAQMSLGICMKALNAI